jgi:hypothetical protein
MFLRYRSCDQMYTVLGGEDGLSVILVSWGNDFVLILASLS